MKNVERDVPYHAFYFNPTDGKEFDLGTFVCTSPPPSPFPGPAAPPLFADHFESDRAAGTVSAGKVSEWKDYGTPTRRQDARMIGGKGMVTVLETSRETDATASVTARSDAEAGIILRFHDPDNYLVALYSPLFKTIFLHDRRNGQWGAMLGEVPVPETGPAIRLTAGASGDYAAMTLTDGTKTVNTPLVKVTNTTAGKAGLWLYQIGDRQEFSDFQLFRAHFAPPKRDANALAHLTLWTDEYRAPALPSPQDWILVLERAKP